MPLPINEKTEWVFVIDTTLNACDAITRKNVSQAQAQRALDDAGMHMFSNEQYNTTQAMNLMLERYGCCCWSESLPKAMHAQMFDVNEVQQAGLFKCVDVKSFDIRC